MTERGGPTTQSGIYYQNAVAAIYIGRIFDQSSQNISERICKVRVEAPTSVDDIVVSYIDGHILYIQVKEAMYAGDDSWKKVWKDFASQFCEPNFQKGKDRLVLHIGKSLEIYYKIENICVRARNADDYEEWWKRLTDEQKRLIDSIKPNLRIEIVNDADLFKFFGHIDIEIWPIRYIEQNLVPFSMPPSNVTSTVLYRFIHSLVGRKSRERGVFDIESVVTSLTGENLIISEPVNLESLKIAIKQCSSVLRSYKSTIGKTGVHIRREVVDSIVNWASTVNGENRIALLLDQAGMGKSVVMWDILTELESKNVVTLGIKADQQLTGVTLINEFQQRLGLSSSIESILAQLATYSRVVVLIDQIDALSLSLARDEQALNVVIDLVSRINRIPGVAIIVSCRMFDRNSDPRLRSIETATEFRLAEFSDVDVSSVLRRVGIEFNDLQAPLQKLLKTPLHLDLFIRSFEFRQKNTDVRFSSQISSLQDLYDLFWNNIIMKPLSEGPIMSEREEVLRVLMEYMSAKQRTTAPQSILFNQTPRNLERAMNWLASEGVIIINGVEWSFMHQTFFDYMYAKNFIEQGTGVKDFILQHDQGLKTRLQMIQILSYLRGRDNIRYLREINELLECGYYQKNVLRPHLRDLLVRWFGALSNPTNDEWVICQRFILFQKSRHDMIYAMQGNLGWFVYFKEQILPELLKSEKEDFSRSITSYLISMTDIAQIEIISLVISYLNKSIDWNNRIAMIVSSVRGKYTLEAAILFERICQLFPSFHLDHFYDLGRLTNHPSVVCRIIRLAFDRKLADFLKKHSDPSMKYLLSLTSVIEGLNSGFIVDILRFLSENVPEEFLDTMLSWSETVFHLSGEVSGDSILYHPDELSRDWHGKTYVVKFSLTHNLVASMINLAKNEPETFRVFCKRLMSSSYRTPHLIILNSYSAVVEKFYNEAYQYIIGDKRRLNVGNDSYDTAQLISRLYRYLNHEQRLVIESLILNYAPIRMSNLYGLQWRGVEQFYLLKSLPEEHRSRKASKALQEWQRKFPNLSDVQEPTRFFWIENTSSVNLDKVKKMSDISWLREITKIQTKSKHNKLLGQGNNRLSEALKEIVKDDPERFVKLLNSIDCDLIIDGYVNPLLIGISSSGISDSVLFSVIKRFIERKEDNIRRCIIQILESRSDSSIPEDIVVWLDYINRNENDGYESENEDMYLVYANSNRGCAFRILMRSFEQKDGSISYKMKWDLIDYMIANAPQWFHSGIIQELIYLINEYRDRSIDAFVRIIKNNPSLIRSSFADDFIYHAMYKRFPVMLPFIQLLMNDESDNAQEQGASLICVASISPRALDTDDNIKVAREMAKSTINGRSNWRKGASLVYAHNIQREMSDYCIEQLILLLNDEDSSVRNNISNVFYSLQIEHSSEHSLAFRRFIESYAASACYYSGVRQFLEYLSKVALLDPEWTISIIMIILQNSHEPDKDFWYRGSDELIRITLRIYNNATATPDRRVRAMDIFDQLAEKYSRDVQFILDEWDVR